MCVVKGERVVSQETTSMFAFPLLQAFLFTHSKAVRSLHQDMI